MQAHKLRGHDCERCSGCGGVWFDRDAYLGHGAALGLAFLDPPGEPVPSSSKRQCLRCGVVLQVHLATIASIPVDRCEGHGVWFDGDGLEQFVRALSAISGTRRWVPIRRP